MAEDQQRRGGPQAGDHASGTPVGSVAEEAARLLEALGGWAERSGYAAAAPAAPTPPPGVGADQGAEARAASCPECGAVQGAGRSTTCAVCPVCRGISLLKSVRPETVDRLADLASAVAVTLRDLAGRHREEQAAADDPPAPSRVQDIPVEDGDTEGARA